MPYWRRTAYWFLCLALCCLLGRVALAQDQDTGPVVVGFVEDRGMRTSSVTDNGADGLTRLAEIFRSLGAQTQFIRLQDKIPDTIDIIVLVRPMRSLSNLEMARLWLHLARGKHLLVAVDPDNVATSRAGFAGSGLNRLLDLDYGLSLGRAAMLESWFTLDQLNDVLNVWSNAEAENFVAHPIVAPLAHFDVPVQIWGAANTAVDPLGPDSMAWPLIYTETAYGETNANALRPRTEPPPPLEFNIGSDLQGRVLLGGIAVNTATGSRVALLGDSEIVQNLYGLARVSEGSNVPRYPGDRVLVERLAAWLMGLPEESWPGLPEGITWIALDGDASDWPQGGPVTNDEILDAPYNDIQSVQAFSNDQYVYVLIEAHDIVDEPRLELRMRDGNQVRDIIYSQGIFAMVNQDLQTTPLTDAAIAIGQVIELRLPRRALGQANRFEDLCIGTLNLPNMDCAGAPVQIRLTNDIDPVPLRSRGLPSAYVINNANLRTGPSTTTQVQATLSARTPLTLLGRNEAADWVLVRNGRWEGWMSAPLLQMNIEVNILPVVPSP